ncbi:MAG TPA: ATP-binding protein, partial [Coriobacteriia bacterium]
MKRLSLGMQLAVAFAAVAAMTALLAGVIVTWSWANTFDSYVRERVREDASILAEAAGRTYAAYGSWNRGALVDLGVFGASRGLRVQVLDSSDAVVLDSAELQVSTGMPGVTMMPGMGRSDSAQRADRPMREPIVRVPVYVDGGTVGAVRVASIAPGTFLTDRDLRFRTSSTTGLAVAGLLALGLASTAGFIYSRVFSRPIERLTRTAAALRSGARDARTGMHGEDPVGTLGRTLDEMADAIEAEREFERRLTADVAHELRTPLQSIQATVEAMQDGVLPADPERLGVVRDETVRLGRLADSILELSRLENRSAPMRSAPVDLSVPVSRSVETHRALLESLELELVQDIAEGVLVIGDVDRLTQAVGNLLSNAARYTPAGGVITVALTQQGSDAIVSVSDTGIGVPEEDRERVFARFWRSDAARERSRSGFGIGL